MSENNSRMFRGPVNTIKYEVEPCQKGSTDCMYLSSGGGCSAESCIFAELPTMISSNRELTCSVCGVNKKSFSTYSGISSYICSECQEKLKKITPTEKTCSVCGVNKIAIDQYICSECQEKLIKVIGTSTCPICGASINVNESICSTCAEKIKEKINE